jgi:hypothetical protein
MFSRRPSACARLAAVAAFVFGMSAIPMLAQTSPPRTEGQQYGDVSELAPAPSTLKGAINDSFRLLMLEHSTRIAFQQKTRRELVGPFFGDYLRSVRMPQTWNDGDSWGVSTIQILASLRSTGRVERAPRRGPLSTAFSSNSGRSAKHRSATWAYVRTRPAGSIML